MLELMMSGLVEEVADCDYTGSFSGEVHRKRGCGAAEYANDGVQLLAATLKIGTGHGEIGGTGCGHSGEENAVLPVQKFVGFEDRLGHDDGRNGDGFSGSRGGVQSWPLRQRGGAERKEKECSKFRQKIRKFAESHRCQPFRRAP